MRSIFLVCAFVVVGLSIVCIFISLSQKKRISKYMARLHLMAAVSTVFATVPLFTTDLTVATLSISLYYACIDWYLFAFVDFFFSFTDTSFDAPLIKVFRTDFKILGAADSFLILSTLFTGFTFTLKEVVKGGEFVMWKETVEYGFMVHSAFDCLITFFILAFLVKKCSSAAKFHKQKIYFTMACFSAIMVMNLSFMIFGSEYRFSVISYGLLTLLINVIGFYVMPLKLNLRIKGMIAEDMSDAVVFFDSESNCVFMNRMARKIFKTEEKCRSRLAFYSASGCDSLKLKDDLEVDGEIRHFNILVNMLKDSRGRNIGSYMVFSDISREYEMIKKEKWLSTHDNLSGFFNRSTFFKEMEDILQNELIVSRYLVCTNIKNFKMFNDRFGSEEGDKVLKKQAAALLELLSCVSDGKVVDGSKSGDCIVGRTSGDRFALLVRKDSFDLEWFCGKLREVQNSDGIGKYKLRVLLGIYEITEDSLFTESVYSMYDKANLAIKNVSDEVSNMVYFYDSALMEQLKHERKIIGMFESALENGEFCMFLQPQVSSRTKRAVGAEALVRWVSKNGMVPPGEFIPVLENASLIHRLDRFIWEEAAKKLAEWKSKGIDLYIAVNISVKDFYYLDLYGEFTSLVEKYGINPVNLKLEITETVLMHDLKIHSEILSKLRAYGFFIEMDDFGSGYSSLSMLKSIKMDILKIDMAFLKKSKNPDRSKTIIESIINMAKKLGMKIVTEGVEENQHVKFLTDAGCDIFQGYYYSCPVSVSEFEEKFMDMRKEGAQ